MTITRRMVRRGSKYGISKPTWFNGGQVGAIRSDTTQVLPRARAASDIPCCARRRVTQGKCRCHRAAGPLQVPASLHRSMKQLRRHVWAMLQLARRRQSTPATGQRDHCRFHQWNHPANRVCFFSRHLDGRYTHACDILGYPYPNSGLKPYSYTRYVSYSDVIWITNFNPNIYSNLFIIFLSLYIYVIIRISFKWQIVIRYFV